MELWVMRKNNTFGNGHGIDRCMCGDHLQKLIRKANANPLTVFAPLCFSGEK